MIETSVAYISLLDKDILRIEFKPDCFVDVREFEENMNAYKKLMTTEKVYLLTIATPGSSSSLEVRNNFSSPERSKFKHAEAFVISTLAHRLVANFVTRMRPPKHPLRFFNHEKDALRWLNKIREKNKAKLNVKN
jgi:hypothetical protein